LMGAVFALARDLSAQEQLSPDPVETAYESLDQTLRNHRAEQESVSQFWKLEQSKSALLTSQASAVIQGVLGQGSIPWLENQSDPSFTGIPVVAGREGLLVSFTIPTNDPLASLRGRSWTYDNAVAAIAFLSQGQLPQARSVLEALNRLVTPEGTIGFSYQVDSLGFDPKVRSGTLAWVGYAFAFYQKVTGDAAYQAAAERIAASLKTLQLEGGLVKGGPDVGWVSTEHNVDSYFFYRELYRVTGDTGHQATALEIKNALLTRLWVSDAKGGHFLQGLNDPIPSLDANSWGAIFLWAVGENAKANQALKYVESTFRNTKKISGSSTRITGYAPDAAKKTVWLEGTLGVSAAYRRVGQLSQSDSILNQVYNLQKDWERRGLWRGALPYAMPRYQNADGDTFAEWESVTSTGWLNLALALKNVSSPFWDHD